MFGKKIMSWLIVIILNSMLVRVNIWKLFKNVWMFWRCSRKIVVRCWSSLCKKM